MTAVVRSEAARRRGVCVIVAVLLFAASNCAPALADERLEFFESRIRPVLVERCYECHNSAGTAEGGLTLDHRDAILNGGGGGKIVVPGQPQQSRLLAILRHEVEGLEMPQSGPKLEPEVIADFEKWIATGAFDPRDRPPTADEVAAITSWESTLARRKQWWSFQPIQNPDLPVVENDRWKANPVDRFIYQKLQAAGITPAEPADAFTLVRRLYFNLIGLRPAPEESMQWSARIEKANDKERDAVIEELVDSLLQSPKFGERWARHWMDWIRYAESHGSEGDPAIDNAWVYRDYLIRALNADVPYDQLVREHVAGDLLPLPRLNEQLQINESAIGPSHWRMVFHGFAPTDALDEKVRFTDDQINSFSKAFLGLTVSCARCHDHKFDAISQKDYYALFGILASCRPGRATIDLPATLDVNRAQLQALKPRIRSAIAADWLSYLKDQAESRAKQERWKEAEHPLHLLFILDEEIAKGAGFEPAWKKQVEDYQAKTAQWREFEAGDSTRIWNLDSERDYAEWYKAGSGLPDQPQNAGDFAIVATGDSVLTGIYPSGTYSHLLSAKHAARLESPDFVAGENSELWVQCIGDGAAALRYAVQNYPRDGTVYPVTTLANKWTWQQFDISYWKGDPIHVELACALDAPLLVKDKARSWFGVRKVVVKERGKSPPSATIEQWQPIFDAAETTQIKSRGDLVSAIQTAIREAVQAWQVGNASDEQALMLDACLRYDLLPNSRGELASAQPLIDEYRRLEVEIPVPARVPTLQETIGRDQPLFVRGNHKQPAEAVPRRFLETVDATPFDTQQSGRLELAESLLRDDNPLVRRVIVNRLWHHLFGRGIVSTPDNLGRMGEQPTHPELLDWLANRLKEDKWSLKKIIRLMVTSQSWQLSSRPASEAKEKDPDNRLFSHARVRRLEAEAIRDSLLATSGQLDAATFGRPVAGDSARRSVYVRVVRNSLDPFLRSFDFPEPFSSTGRRDVTNVPAQSLTMMNDPRVSALAASWADRVCGSDSNKEKRVQRLLLEAFARPATEKEVSAAIQFVDDTADYLQALHTQHVELRAQEEQNAAAIEGILQPIRERLALKNGAEDSKRTNAGPRPIARWEFDESPQDAIGRAHCELHHGAKLDAGSLRVRNGGYATATLSKTVREKTLEVWVQLDDLNQAGGGVMTIQSPDGVVFDSIVFAERDPRQWLAGSNNFARTQSFNGPAEAEAASKVVHVAIAYLSDGTIAGYRNGKPYGQPYKSSGPHEFKTGEAVIAFGLRHLPAGGNRMLAGKLLKAQLYDRALTADEIAVTSGTITTYVSDEQIIAELSAVERARVEELRAAVANLKDQRQSLDPITEVINDTAAWTELAKSLFTAQEFIYVR